MSWGWKITLLYLGFVSFMTMLVIGTTTTRFHLVTEDYYQKEQLVDDHFIRVKNTEKLAQPVSILYQAEPREIQISFPDEIGKVEGEILCYRPSNSDLDKTFPFSLDEEQTVRLDASNLLHGVWKIQIDWEGDGQSFFSGKVVVIPK
ncbi:MAG: FixH family protein [Bacteroidota bacterium]